MPLFPRARISALLLATLAPLSLSVVACSSPDAGTAEDDGELRGATPIATILKGVSAETTWAQLPEKKKKQLENAARVYLARVKHDWGTKGLDEKEERLVDAPTAPMLENFDRISAYFLAGVVADDFKASTGIKSPELALQMKRLYLAWCAMHRHVLIANPDFKDWDGGALREMLVVDDEILDQQKAWVRDVEGKLGAIKGLDASETAMRDKLYYFTRQLKRGTTGFNLGADDNLQTGGASAQLYDFATSYKADGTAIISDEDKFLQALNATTFVAQKWTNVGTVDTFNWNVDQFADPAFLAEVGFDPATNPVAAKYVTLVNWWKERTNALPDATARCTVYSTEDRNALWDGLTATNLVNADGKTTLDVYAKSYVTLAASNNDGTKAVAKAALDSAFPSGSKLLTAAQKAKVASAIDASSAPAALVETITASLDTATGKKDASTAFSAAYGSLTMIGGSYKDGDPVSAADAATVNAMWEDVKGYVKTHYSGYPVDIAALLPKSLVLTTSGGTFTGTAPGQAVANLSVGLGRPWSKASLYSTLLHEGKHAIDFASKAPVQGAAWEGGGLAVEYLVWPRFVDEVMASEAAKLPYYKLSTAIDNVRLTATTDATLKVFLRPHCNTNEPNSIDFVKNIIAGYGYSDPDTQLLRSRRAHQGTQYLSYELGRVVVLDAAKYLQTEIGAAPVVDPFLLQACNLPNPKADAATVTALKACIAGKK